MLIPLALCAGSGKQLLLNLTQDRNPWSPNPESPQSVIPKLKHTLFSACNSSTPNYTDSAETQLSWK